MEGITKSRIKMNNDLNTNNKIEALYKLSVILIACIFGLIVLFIILFIIGDLLTSGGMTDMLLDNIFGTQSDQILKQQAINDTHGCPNH